MKEILNWIKTHKLLVAIITVLVFVLPLLVVHILFKWYSGIWWIEAEWLASAVEENNEKYVFATLIVETKRLWSPLYKNLFCILMKMLKLIEGIEHIYLTCQVVNFVSL